MIVYDIYKNKHAKASQFSMFAKITTPLSLIYPPPGSRATITDKSPRTAECAHALMYLLSGNKRSRDDGLPESGSIRTVESLEREIKKLKEENEKLEGIAKFNADRALYCQQQCIADAAKYKETENLLIRSAEATLNNAINGMRSIGIFKQVDFLQKKLTEEKEKNQSLQKQLDEENERNQSLQKQLDEENERNGVFSVDGAIMMANNSKLLKKTIVLNKENIVLNKEFADLKEELAVLKEELARLNA